jgi:hypothetical protein
MNKTTSKRYFRQVFLILETENNISRKGAKGAKGRGYAVFERRIGKLWIELLKNLILKTLTFFRLPA